MMAAKPEIEPATKVKASETGLKKILTLLNT